MKKIISIILSIVILMGIEVTSFAQADPKPAALPPDVIVEAHSPYYVNGNVITVMFSIRESSPFLENVRIYMDCNKDVLKYNGERVIYDSENTKFTIDETDSGYVITYTYDIYSNLCVKVMGAGVDFEVASMEDPNVRLSGTMKFADSGEKGSLIIDTLPCNKVFEQNEIPKLSVDGDLELFITDNVLYLHKAVSLSSLKQKITSTLPEYKVVFEAFGDEERDFAVTGDKFYIEFSDTRSEELEICIMGDVNRNGTVTAADARLTLRYAAKIEVFPENFPKSADIDCDGSATPADARKILRVAAGLDKFENPEKTVIEGREFVIEKLKNAGSGAYNWKCTVSDESAFEISDTIAPPEGVEIKPGTPFEQTFTFKALKTGVYDVHFELIASWEDEPIDEFHFTVTVHLDVPIGDVF